MIQEQAANKSVISVTNRVILATRVVTNIFQSCKTTTNSKQIVVFFEFGLSVNCVEPRGIPMKSIVTTAASVFSVAVLSFFADPAQIAHGQEDEALEEVDRPV